MKKITAALTLGLLMASANAEWQLVVRGHGDNGSLSYIDQETIKFPSVNTRRIWVFVSVPKGFGPNNQGHSFKELTVFDCSDDSYESLAALYYSGTDGNEGLLHSDGPKTKQFLVPDSSLDKVAKLVCKLKSR